MLERFGLAFSSCSSCSALQEWSRNPTLFTVAIKLNSCGSFPLNLNDPYHIHPGTVLFALAQVLTFRFSPLPSACSEERINIVVPVDLFWPGCSFLLICLCLFCFWCYTSMSCDGRSVSFHSCLADWRAIRPGHTQAAPSKKKRCLSDLGTALFATLDCISFSVTAL